ncbi:UPF0146 family protein [Halomarina litorea]|uniref:UPF0146 family protein n=1 Tax=Halomarina litorea TaxID=2961595 RepID=UPI0020C4F8E8|nr:UPF0146 family protein [Halomarina sp. BCD28]
MADGDTDVNPATREALVSRLARHDRLVEVGVGNRPDVARALAAGGAEVTATDVHDRPVPDGVRFVRDDVTAPDDSVYADADALYALNLPPDLHGPTWALARRHDAAFLFTTLGGDPAAVRADPETLPGETLFTARPAPGDRVGGRS